MSTGVQIPLVMERRADCSLRRRAAFGRFLELHQDLSSRVTSVRTLPISLTRSRRTIAGEGPLFFWHSRAGRSRRLGRSDADSCSSSKRVGGIDNYFVRFSDTTQDFRVYAKVPPNLDVQELHNAIGVHYSDLKTLATKYKRIVRQNKHFSQNGRGNFDRGIAPRQDLALSVIHLQLNKHS